jgi:hypothetical protein
MPPESLVIASPFLSDQGTVSGTAGNGDFIIDNVIDPDPTLIWQPSADPASLQWILPTDSNELNAPTFWGLISTNAVATTKNLLQESRDLEDGSPWVTDNVTMALDVNGIREPLLNTAWRTLEPAVTATTHRIYQDYTGLPVGVLFQDEEETVVTFSVLVDDIQPVPAGRELYLDVEETGVSGNVTVFFDINTGAISTGPVAAGPFTNVSAVATVIDANTWLLSLTVGYTPDSSGTGVTRWSIGAGQGGAKSFTPSGAGQLINVALSKLEVESTPGNREINDGEAAGLIMMTYSQSPSGIARTESRYLASFLHERLEGVKVSNEKVHCWHFKEDFKTFTSITIGPYVMQIHHPSHPTSLEIGRLMIDNHFASPTQHAAGWSGGRSEPVRQFESRLGDKLRRRLPRKDGIDFSIDHLTEAQAWGDVFELDRTRGTSGDLLVIPCPQSEYAHQQSVHGYMSRTGMTVQPFFEGYRRKFKIVEL